MIEIQGIDKKMIANNLKPFEPTHPGELIKDEIECRNISQKKFANEIGVSYQMVNEIVNGKRSISTQFALLCEAALGVPAHILLGLQFDYDLQVAKQNETFMTKLKKIKNIAAIVS